MNRERISISMVSSIVKKIFLFIFLLNYHDCDPVERSDALNLVNQYNSENSIDLGSKELRQTKSVKKSLNNFNYNLTYGWPVIGAQLGQISAVDIDLEGNIVIFHRGSHKWNDLSFNNLNNHYQQIADGPIPIATVIAIDPKTRKLVYSWGANLFYLPHGLTFDTKGYVWLTDVALHQVFKFVAKGSDKPEMALGEAFVPGNDDKHFCKPTSVAIDSRSGDFYVADGYCNSRVIRFNSEGKLLNQWGQPESAAPTPSVNTFNIVHKVVLIEESNTVCVADREHGRIQCFKSPLGEFIFSISINEFSGRLFSISYSPFGGGILFAVNGGSYFNPEAPIKGFLFNLTTRELLTSFGDFKQPHDIVASKDAKSVYIVEIGPNCLWRFEKEVPIGSPILSQNSDGATGTKLSLPLKNSSNLNIARTFILKSQLIPAKIASLSSSPALLLVLVPLIISVIIIILIVRRRTSRLSSYSPLQEIKGWVTGYKATKNELNLGRILHDPKRSGFNQLAMDESDNEAELINGDIHSESEVEEFNVSSIRKI
ncbi:peptidyl-glycine alpha-amidating monooxygenase B [Tetranychus urticae]|uniref:Peptidylamidoglycolate lyase n=1 Tax=Tetranychus urticae TaxID=32264 RepID=T1KEL8_TETUR|nr:peptidyl-glycine alpha-amidating monooxygenase B [Tetranychus urticae]